MSAAPTVVAQSLSKCYGEVCAVKGIDFVVGEGETFGLLGPNGAGKSSTLKMIYCRNEPSGGSLQVAGLDVVRDARQVKGLVGVVPQENNLDPDLDVLDNLRVYARYYRIDAQVAEGRARELLEFFELGDKAHVDVEELSGGMKRRLIIARALINKPPLLVLDEPTTGLDPHVRHVIWDRLRELRRQKVTIILSSHYMDEAEKLCDRLVIIDHGRVLASGTPRELITRYARRFALEIHGHGDCALPAITAAVDIERRGSSVYLYAAASEALTPLLQRFEGHCEAELRPSNLEDVFLRLTGREGIE